MFKVERPNEAPVGLAKDYKSEDVVLKLRDIFYSKCYLCETKRPQAPEVEHFIPQSLDPKRLLTDWNNLFYACRRCNSIKSANDAKLLDCTKVDAFEAIICEVPSRQSKPILIEVNPDYDSVEARNTAELLDDCYNKESTVYRKITRSQLRQDIAKYLAKYMKYVSKLYDDEAGKREKIYAEDRLEVMLQRDFAFHAFWRRMFLEDEILMKSYSHLLIPEEELEKAG